MKNQQHSQFEVTNSINILLLRLNVQQIILMYKVGVMVMGKMNESPKKVKEIILEVQGKTKMSNILEYLIELGKIQNTNVEFSLEKGGRPINDISNVTQALKYATPVNGVLKLYLYEKDQFLNAAIQTLRKSQQLQDSKRAKQQERKLRQNSLASISPPLTTAIKKEEEPQSKRCCCF